MRHIYWFSHIEPKIFKRKKCCEPVPIDDDLVPYQEYPGIPSMDFLRQGSTRTEND